LYGRLLSSTADIAGVKELPSFAIHEPAGFLAAMFVYHWPT
jgi:hypothetical protein